MLAISVPYSQHGDWGKPNNPICHLCRDMQPPGNRYGAASVLIPPTYVPTVLKCTDLHQMGKDHKITAQMCGPIRHYMADICECSNRKPYQGWIVIKN
jgi:hypothetical protein